MLLWYLGIDRMAANESKEGFQRWMKLKKAVTIPEQLGWLDVLQVSSGGLVLFMYLT